MHFAIKWPYELLWYRHVSVDNTTGIVWSIAKFHIKFFPNTWVFRRRNLRYPVGEKGINGTNKFVRDLFFFIPMSEIRSVVVTARSTERVSVAERNRITTQLCLTDQTFFIFFLWYRKPGGTALALLPPDRPNLSQRTSVAPGAPQKFRARSLEQVPYDVGVCDERVQFERGQYAVGEYGDQFESVGPAVRAVGVFDVDEKSDRPECDRQLDDEQVRSQGRLVRVTATNLSSAGV